MSGKSTIPLGEYVVWDDSRSIQTVVNIICFQFMLCLVNNLQIIIVLLVLTIKEGLERMRRPAAYFPVNSFTFDVFTSAVVMSRSPRCATVLLLLLVLSFSSTTLGSVTLRELS